MKINGLDIVKYRKENHLNQTEFAKILGVSTKTIANYEAGNTIPESKQEILRQIIRNQTQASEPGSRYFNIEKLATDVIENETELLKVQLFRMWLETKAQERAIEILKEHQNQ